MAPTAKDVGLEGTKTRSTSTDKEDTFGSSEASQEPTTTPVSKAGKQKKRRQRTQPEQVTDEVLYSDLYKENDTDEKMSALVPYDPNLSDIKGTPLSH